MLQSGFCDSEFTRQFFGGSFHYTPPSRQVVFGPLLNDIYADIKKQVELECKFAQPDSFYTMSTDMRQMENGVSVRNYMIILDKATFMHKGANVGSERPTADIGAVNNVDAIREVDEDSCAAFTNGH